MINKKYIILGQKRSGKDSFAEILFETYGITYSSSSDASNKIFLFDILKEKYGYKTHQECFDDRVNHRDEWYKLICDYNSVDKTRLAKDITKDYDMYVGIRDLEEFNACVKNNIFDLIVWVDASERVKSENESFMEITKSMADVIIDNNGTYEEFRERVIRFGKFL